MTDLEKYLAVHRAAGTDPKPAVVKILAAGEAAKPAEPVIDVSNTKPAAELNMTTKEFLDEQNRLEWARRNQHEVDAINAMGQFDRDAWEAERLKALGRAMIGSRDGATNIRGEKP